MAPRSEEPKLIIPVIDFELVQPICPRYINVTDRQTDGRTDGRTTYDSNTALAVRASRGKNLPYFGFGNLATLALPSACMERYTYPTSQTRSNQATRVTGSCLPIVPPVNKLNSVNFYLGTYSCLAQCVSVKSSSNKSKRINYNTAGDKLYRNRCVAVNKDVVVFIRII